MYLEVLLGIVAPKVTGSSLGVSAPLKTHRFGVLSTIRSNQGVEPELGRFCSSGSQPSSMGGREAIPPTKQASRCRTAGPRRWFYVLISPKPASRARMIACARSATCSFKKILETWLRTVFWLRYRRWAISVLFNPCAIRSGPP